MSMPSTPRRCAVLLVNTGTPAAPDSAAVRAFLRRFLSDPRVVELPRPLWLPLLYGLVLPLRSPRSAHKYRAIWQNEGSPLTVNTLRLCEALGRALTEERGAIDIRSSYLYSRPFVGETLDELRAAGVRRLMVLPLFPQASGTTTGAVFDQIGAALRRWRHPPELRYVAEYHDSPEYIAALAATVRDHWRLHGREAHLLMSFHGIPVACVARGDRYGDACKETSAALANALGLEPHQWTLSFQSRFGAARWLGPPTDRTLQELARRGQHAVTVICPGFAADCLETLEEIAITARESFLAAGGTRFDYIPALNGRVEHARALAQLVLRTTGDWS
jgi:ferrochelatase